MKKFHQRDEHETDSSKSTEMKRRKNMKRLGGGGLSLQTFANMKSENNRYNPSLIKKQKEFYKNAKYVSKFRKSMKQQNFNDKNETGESSSKVHETGESSSKVHETGESSSKVDDNDKQKFKSNKRIGLEDLYKQTKEEMDKARREREAAFQAKKEAKEEAESRRKVAKGKMMRKTRHGQPVMKYRIEHLLESIKKSAGID